MTHAHGVHTFVLDWLLVVAGLCVLVSLASLALWSYVEARCWLEDRKRLVSGKGQDRGNGAGG